MNKKELLKIKNPYDIDKVHCEHFDMDSDDYDEDTGNYQCEDCIDCFNCLNCSDCYDCSWLKGRQYCIKNIQLTKEEYTQKMKEIEEWTEPCCICKKPMGHNEFSGYIKDEKYCDECDEKTFIPRDGRVNGKSYGYFAGGESQEINLSEDTNQDVQKVKLIRQVEVIDVGDLSISIREKEGKEKRLIELQKYYINNK